MDKWNFTMSEAGESRQTEDRKIARAVGELPELKEGFARLVHFTDDKFANEITKTGLDYRRQGMLMSTASVYSKEEDVEYATADPRFSGEGVRAVILDIPMEDVRKHNDIVNHPGVVPERYVVGVIDPKTLGEHPHGEK